MKRIMYHHPTNLKDAVVTEAHILGLLWEALNVPHKHYLVSDLHKRYNAARWWTAIYRARKQK